MSREWRLNPPPNWPLTAGVVVGLDWRPDPAWGPPPVGWQLWRRERVSRFRPLTHTVLGLMLGTAALVGALVGEPTGAPEQSTGRTTVIGPGTFPAGSFYRASAGSCPARPGTTGAASGRWADGGVRPTDC